MPDAPAQSERGQISGPELTRASWQSGLLAAAAGAAVVVLQGFESGRYTFGRESLASAASAFLIVFLTLALKAYYSGPIPAPSPPPEKK